MKVHSKKGRFDQEAAINLGANMQKASSTSALSRRKTHGNLHMRLILVLKNESLQMTIKGSLNRKK